MSGRNGVGASISGNTVGIRLGGSISLNRGNDIGTKGAAVGGSKISAGGIGINNVAVASRNVSNKTGRVAGVTDNVSNGRCTATNSGGTTDVKSVGGVANRAAGTTGLANSEGVAIACSSGATSNGGAIGLGSSVALNGSPGGRITVGNSGNRMIVNSNSDTVALKGRTGATKSDGPTDNGCLGNLSGGG